jgi:hypothetical protein
MRVGSALAGASLAYVVVAALCALLLLAPIAVGDERFGIESAANRLETKGEAVRQAGEHPETMTTTIIFKHVIIHVSSSSEVLSPIGNVREIETSFPPGLIFNPNATAARCTEEQLVTISNTGNGCPPSSAVGEVSAYTELGVSQAKLYNMLPPPSISADFAANIEGLGIIVHIVGRADVRGGYHIAAYASGIVQHDGFSGAVVTLNGFPNGLSGTPLITMPTGCGGVLTTTVKAWSWQGETAEEPFTPTVNEGRPDSEERPLTVTGCNRLRFSPKLQVQPSEHQTDSPSGLDVGLTIPQEESATGLASADLKEAVVTLPPGFTVNAAAAAGLSACPLLRGTEEPDKEEQERHKEVVGINLETNISPNCPDSSKIGWAEVDTPLLGPEHPLHGAIYLAQQGENPFHNLLSLYLVAEEANNVVKIPGEVSLDLTSGQITTRFGENPVIGSFLPEFPFSHVEIHLFAGEHAALATPSQCGVYTVTSQLTPWSAPESGPPATPGSSFEINKGCHGPEFVPSLIAGTESNIAGSFSPLVTTLKREGGEGELGQVQVSLPPGLLAAVGSVPLCPEAQAQLGECSQSSRIGHVVTGVGAGSSPFYVSGEVFLTGPYNGAPYGLAIEVPAVAGPFDLDVEDRPIVVRAALTIDPHTAVATVTTDPLPRILQGIPLQVRTVNVTIDRPGFTFNPTNCTPMAFTGTATSTTGLSAPLSSRFQAANCASLAFKPTFSVTTSGRTSRADGASLDTKLSYPAGSQGTEANIRSVKVELPKQLPSRLTTLQKACLAQVFESNPAACPAPSVVGIVRISTPLLADRLTGPAYFVSHGGEAYPSLVVVAQADGVRADLVGTTFISKAGITSSTFKETPDVPFNSFELYLPQGRYSALAANGNLCKANLRMPTTFVAQNGLEIHQSTTIAVTGCPKAAKKKAKAKKASSSARRRAGVR